MTERVVANYGWTDSADVESHSYLFPAISTALKEVGAERVLDLGCGNGALTHALVAAGFAMTGCDADKKGIEHARAKGGDFAVASVYDDPSLLGAHPYDAVVSAEVVEHLYQPRFLPRFARAVLREGGYLIVTTPYHGYLKNLALSLTDGWDRHWNPLWDGGHIKFWSPATLRSLLAEEGFTIVSSGGVGRIPLLWKSMVVVARLGTARS